MGLLQDPELDGVPDLQSIASYLAYQYVPHPRSAFVDVEKLPPATTLAVDARGANQPVLATRLRGPSAERRSPRARGAAARADLGGHSYPPDQRGTLGAFLSGGVDSSAVVAAMADQMNEPVKTFSIGFRDADFDEVRFARIVAKRFATDHHELVVEPHALKIMPKLARHYGEPFADSSAIPSFYLAEMTSGHVTVALNGDGGDESFAGYPRYVASDMASRLDWLPGPVRRLGPHLVAPFGDGHRSTSIPAKTQRLARLLAMDPHERYTHWMTMFRRDMREQYLQPSCLPPSTRARSRCDWRRLARILEGVGSTECSTQTSTPTYQVTCW